MSLNNEGIALLFLLAAAFAFDSWTTRDRQREIRSFWWSMVFLFGALVFAVILE